jgi:hypothetical protein
VIRIVFVAQVLGGNRIANEMCRTQAAFRLPAPGGREHRDVALARQRVSITPIVRQSGKSRGLVHRVVRSGRTEVFRSRNASLDLFPTQLDLGSH